MPSYLPIYNQPPISEVELVEPKDRCTTCTTCELSGLPDAAKVGAIAKREVLKRYRTEKRKAVKADVEAEVAQLMADRLKGANPRVRSVCMPPEGQPGGLLVISDYPGDDEDRAGRPMIGRAGRYFRETVRKYWTGPIALDNALKCAPRSIEIKDTHIKACRPYLAATIAEVKPERIIAMGSWAIYSVLGRRPPVFSVRRGFGWVSDGMIPVFMMMNPAAARRNHFVSKWFESDLKWACTTDVDALRAEVPLEGFAMVIRNLEDAVAAKADLLTHEWFTWDTETAGKHYTKIFKVLTVGMAGKDSNDAWVWSKEALADPQCFAVFKELLAHPRFKKVHQNGKYDTLSVDSAYGITVDGVHGDTLLWRKMLDTDVDGRLEIMQELVGMGGGKEEAEDAIQEAIKKCRARYVGDPKDKKEPTDLDLAEIGPLEHVKAIREGADKPKTHAYALVPDPILYRYVAKDCISTAKIGKKLEPALKKTKEVNYAWEELMKPAAEAIAQVEKWGVQTSLDRIHAFQSQLMMRQQELDVKFRQFDEPGTPFNPGSSRHVAHLLFNKMSMRPPKHTKTGLPCTDAASLKILKDQNPHMSVVSDILEYRLLDKQKGTYADGMERHIRDDSRIHPSYNLTGARTGRLSCSDPNLQNITRGTKDWFGKAARDLFMAPDGRVLVQLDFSQLELRIAAVLSGDEAMKEIFVSGADYHQKTAEMISMIAWGLRPDQITSEHRSRAKVVNFGLLYGMSDAGLAARISSTKQEAAKIRQGVLGTFKKYATWNDEQVELARQTGFTWTWWNGQIARRRALWRIADADRESSLKAEHGASNTPVQGTASDFCLASLVKCVKWLIETNFPAKLVLTVHDSLIFEVDIDFADELIDVVMGIMTSWNSGGVPVLADAEIGVAWGSLFKLVNKGNIWLAKVTEKVDGKKVDKLVPWRAVVLAD